MLKNLLDDTDWDLKREIQLPCIIGDSLKSDILKILIDYCNLQ